MRTNFVLGSLFLLSACEAPEFETESKVVESVTNGDVGKAFDAGTDAGPFCGDGVIQSNEQCDPGDSEHVVISDGSGSLPEGIRYDKWNCNPQTCRRRYIYTPCTGIGLEVESCFGGFCDGTFCQPLALDDCFDWGIENPVVSCIIERQWQGLCGYDRCYPLCQTESDCPQNTVCKTLYPDHDDKVCQAPR